MQNMVSKIMVIYALKVKHMIDGRRCHVERMKINDTHLFFCLFLYRLSTAMTKIQLHCMGYALLEKTNRKGKHKSL